MDISKDIKLQQATMGIYISEDILPGGIGGFFVTRTKEGHLEPYAWIGSAQLDSQGKVKCEIWWFQEERMDNLEGPKIIL
jgi:hypothetical protein